MCRYAYFAQSIHLFLLHTIPPQPWNDPAHNRRVKEGAAIVNDEAEPLMHSA